MAKLKTKTDLLDYLIKEKDLGKSQIDFKVLDGICDYIEKNEREIKSPLLFKDTEDETQ